MSSRAVTAAGVVGVCLCFVIGAAAAFAVVSRSPSRQAHRAGNPAAIRHGAATTVELVELEDDRDGDRFIVRGIVRNPAPVAVDGLVAAVSVFGRDGALLTSGDAPVAATRLAAGAETPFVVIVPRAADVERYHLSFRTAAGVVPHLDKRASGARAGLA